MRNDPISVLLLILVASFAIDRVVAGILFLLSFIKSWTRRFPDVALLKEGVARTRAEKKQKLIYFFLAGVLGVVVLAGFGNIRLLTALGVQPKAEAVAVPKTTASAPPTTAEPKSTAEPEPALPLSAWLDLLLTGLILMGGADRISQILKDHGAPGAEKPISRPIEVTGTLVLEDESGKKAMAGSMGATATSS